MHDNVSVSTKSASEGSTRMAFPLCPQERASSARPDMSAKCNKRYDCEPCIDGKGGSDLERHFADKSIFAPVKADFPLKLGNHSFNDTGANAISRGFLHGWTTPLCPEQTQLTISCVRPFQADLAVGLGQSAVLCRVGCQFMQGYGNCLSDAGLQ